MKKILVAMLILASLAATLSGCNKEIFDTTYSFSKAIVYLPNGEVVEGKVETWNDYENSDQIQVKINGTTYLVHSSNVVLIKEGDN